MTRALVGYTGFVGSNLYSQGEFDGLYNSRNIGDAFGTSPDLLIYAGLRAEKYLANSEPSRDMALIRQAEDNIQRIRPRRLVLISTIDVFKTPLNVDEESPVDLQGLHPYGYNRYQLEAWVRGHYPDALIVRLPALFGQNIKKNFIYDFINVIPSMLKADRFEALARREPVLREYYHPLDNGFYKADVPQDKREMLKDVFRGLGFSALNFTDSRSRYQFYNLEYLYRDLMTALDAGIRLWHPATEPVSAGELYRYLTGEAFVNELNGAPANYNYRTIHASLYGGANGYILDKAKVMADIRRFVER